MKKLPSLFLIVAFFSCNSIYKITEYKVQKNSKTFYPYKDELRIKLNSDTTGVLVNSRKNQDVIYQNFVYQKQLESFIIVKSVDKNFENLISLKQNDTLVLNKKKLYFVYQAANTTKYFLYFKGD